MGRKNKNKKGSSRKPPRPAGGTSASAPAPTNRDWEDSTAAFRREAESAIRAWADGGGGDDGAAAAARLAGRHPASPLALHVLGHARVSLARADEAVAPLRRAARLAPRCPEIAATLAAALLYARRPREALAECARALAVADPTDPALHAAAPRELMAASPQARVAAARERLLGVRADAEALAAAGARHAGSPATAPTKTKPPCCCRCHHATPRSSITADELRGLLTVSIDDLTAHCDDAVSVQVLAGAVEFAKATKAWAYWLCPVCDKVFLDASSFMSHVEDEYLPELKELLPLMPKRAALDSDELHNPLRWMPFEIEEDDPERRKNLERVRDVLTYLNNLKAVPVGLVDRVIKFARGKSKNPLPYCIPSCVASLDSRELKRIVDQLSKHLYRDWEFVMGLIHKGKSKGHSDIISLVQDGSILSLDPEKIDSRSADGSCEVDVLFRWLFIMSSQEESVVTWANMRQKCVHHGNEILKRIYDISELLLKQFNLKCAQREKNHRGYVITQADSIDVEMLLLDNEVGYLKKKLAEAKLTNNCPGEDLHVGDDKDTVHSGDSSDVLHDESFCNDKIPDTDPYIQYEIIRTEECEKSSLSLSDSSNFSSSETGSTSVESGLSSIHHIDAKELHFLNVILRALWHLKQFHDRFLKLPLVLPHFTVEVHCIVCILRKIFNAWDNQKDHGVDTFPGDVETAFSDILNEQNICMKAGANIASEIISTIFELLHKLHTPLDFETKRHTSLDSDKPTLEYRAMCRSRCSDFVCLPHNIFGFPIREQKKCICLEEPSEDKEFTTFYLSIDVSAIRTMEMKSLGQLLRDADKQFQCDTESCQCGNKIVERSLGSAPPIFVTDVGASLQVTVDYIISATAPKNSIFNWPIEKESYIDMSDLLMNITAPLQLDILYDVLPANDYTLATAICCVEEEHLCFARHAEKWIIYGSNTVEFADSWESLLKRYCHRSVQPQILFFERIS
ncbi:hypothetical protein ACP70R_008361 [Stipagrostis hirtigluma subsp. patula]